MIEEAEAALDRCAAALDASEPLAAAIARARSLSPEPMVAFWSQRALGNPVGPQRYRWEVSHGRGTTLPAYAGAPAEWRWRGSDKMRDRDPHGLEERLCLPVQLTETIEWLAEHEAARDLLDEAMPRIRRDFALHIQGAHAWYDTFALWCMCTRPKALERLRPLAVALASTYAATVTSEGAVLGSRYPDHEVPLISASAHLGRALLALGLEVPRVGDLLRFVSRSVSRGDLADSGHSPDPLTALVCADFCTRLNPNIDGRVLLNRLAPLQSDDGFFRVIGPEAPWLTHELVRLAERVTQPFASRFAWPDPPPDNLDRKTALPTYGHFAELAELFQAVDALSDRECHVAFVDLAGFGAFNNRFGQEAGDRVLALFAEHLRLHIDGRVIRDGGDEFLLVSAPTATTLTASIDRARRTWPARFHTALAEAEPVSPRIVVAATRAGALRRCREALGRQIGELKGRPVPPEGLLVS